jgi:beta-lactamase class A
VTACAGSRTRWAGWLAAALIAFLAIAGPARAADPSPAFAERAGKLVELLNGETEPETLFSPAFLAQVPAAQVKAISAQLKASYGPARAMARIEAKSATSGTVFVDFERATARLEMVIGPAPPHLIEGLLVAGAEMKSDDVATLFGELVGLPGEVSLAAARLEEAGPAYFLTQKAERPLAIGSAFKLFVLAELVRAVKAGERRWTDVVPLGRPSLPSGLLQDWPKGSPLTLHSLAALMISRSDNSATDTLLHALGREKVEQLLPVLGVKAPERNRPFLSTREAFALKLGDPALFGRWTVADEAGRRALLDGELATTDAASLDPARLTGLPNAIDTAEWFASPADLVRTLDWLRRSGDPNVLDILAINPGLGRAAAEGFAYFGFKGGSEPGVLNMTFLLRSREDRWMALSVTWNNQAAPLDETRFVALIARLVALMR